MLRVRNILIFLALLSVPAQQPLAYEQNLQDGKDHIFSAGEILHVSVLNEESLSSDYTIDDTGMILMPLIGKVHVAGLDASEIEIFLKTYLQNGFIWNPVVSVYGVRKKGFYIMGAVRTPGHYEMPEDNLSILKAVALAGGFTPDANQDEFEIVRNTDGEEDRSIVKNASNIKLTGGDLIIVRERF